MNCPACNKNLASTLSVCPGCGTMVNDSVREELALKIAPIIKLPKIEPPKVENSKIELKEKSVFIPPISAPLIELAKPMIYNSLTGEIKAKPTAPTLVEFHNKNAAVPEWRLQLQNSVRMRNEQRNLTDNSTTSAVQSAPHRANLVTNGATALKAETLEKIEPVISANPIIASNPTLANAMRRIEESRQRFLVEEIQSAVPKNTVQTAPKTFPHAVPNKPQESFLKRSSETDAEFSSKPIFVPAFSDSQVKFDTNKLPPLPSLDKPSISITKVDLNVEDDDFLEIHKTASPDVTAYGENQILEIEGVDEPEEFDDCAPISLRFNAAVFDLIIGSFASLILLSPFMLFNGKFFSLEGFFAFLVVCSVVMFIYMTTTIGLWGRTFGMKLFSLEIIDIDENEYPTLHQAAVSSAVYLVSLAFGGIGFLTLLVNKEKRAAHDLVSGTIIVKEYQA